MSSEVQQAGERPQPDGDRAYRFRAFISYRHVEPDRRWAKWLHSAIESYRVPKRLHGNAAGQTRLGRVFRDDEELSASSDLSREIKAALDESNFLIVVCSSRTPESEWVNQEVVYFRQLGRDDRILALLVEGEPRESFPRALFEIRPIAADNTSGTPPQTREIEPLAADVRAKHSEPMRRVRRTALLRLLACLLACRFDDLRQRDQERRLHQLAYLGVFFAAMSAIMVGLVAFAMHSLTKEQEAVAKLVQEQTRLKQQLAWQYIERGVRLCEDGKTDLGLATLSLAHETAPEGDPLRAGACNLLGGWTVASPVTFRHDERVNAIAYSPDGRTVLTGWGSSYEHPGGAQLWDAVTWAPKGKPMLHKGQVNAVAFSPDGRTVLTGWEGLKAGGAMLWDAATGVPQGKAMLHENGVYAVAFSPDGRTVLTGWGDSIAELSGPAPGGARLWDAATGVEKGKSMSHEGGVMTVAFRPDGRTVLTGSSDNTARFWDAANGDPKDTRKLQHEGRVTAAAFSPDGRTVLTESEDGRAQFWDAETGAKKGEPMRHGGKVSALAFSPDGRTVLTGSGRDAQLWDALTGEAKGKSMRHEYDVSSVAFSPNGQTVLTGSSRDARLWDIATGPAQREVMRHRGGVNAVAFSPDGRTMFTAWRQRFMPAISPISEDISGRGRLWDTATGAAKCEAMQHKGQVNAVAFSADGRTVITGWGETDQLFTRGAGGAWLWDAATGQPKGEMPHDGKVYAVAFSPDGKTALTGWGKSDMARISEAGGARLWDAATGKSKGEMPHAGQVYAVAFSPDGKTAITGWGKRSGKYALGVSGGGRLWDAANWASKGELLGYDSVVTAAVFSPDGRTMLTGGSTAQLWDTASRKTKGKSISPKGGVVAVAFSRDGRTVLTGSEDGTARWWDATTGATKGEVLPHEDRVKAIAFSPDGRTAVTGSDNATAQLWDTATGAAKGQPMQHAGQVNAVAFSPDGRMVLTGSNDNTAGLWDVPAPLVDDPPGRLRLTIGLRTGLGADDQGQLTTFWTEDWNESGRALLALGGPTLPYSGADLEAMAGRYHRQAVSECEQAGQWFAAAFHLSQLLDRQPDDLDLRVRRGCALAEQAEWIRAIADFSKVAQLKHADDNGLYRIGLARLGADDTAGYQEACEKLRTRAETSEIAETCDHAARLRGLRPCDLPTDAKPFVALSEKAITQKPTNWVYLETLGAVLYRVGRFEDAVQRLDEAAVERVKEQANAKTQNRDWIIAAPLLVPLLQAQPNGQAAELNRTVWVQFFLAMAYQRLGHSDDAKKFFQRAAGQIDADNSQESWDERLIRETLHREAEKLLAMPAADPAKK